MKAIGYARQAILESADVRFGDYRSTIDSILSWIELPQTGRSLGQLVESLKQTAEKKQGKVWDELRKLITDTRKVCLRVQSLFDQQSPWSVIIDDLKPYTHKSSDARTYRLARKLCIRPNPIRSVGKEAIIQACRSRLGDRAIQWLDAAVVLGSENDLSFPPLLGSGANEAGSITPTHSWSALPISGLKTLTTKELWPSCAMHSSASRHLGWSANQLGNMTLGAPGAITRAPASKRKIFRLTLGTAF